MIYQAYQARQDFFAPLRAAAEITTAFLDGARSGPLGNVLLGAAAAGSELLARSTLIHTRPDYEIGTVQANGQDVIVEEIPVFSTPFGTLLHFKKNLPLSQPKLLVVAPMAGHFATLLRDTVRTLLPDHDVYITDWHNARDIPHEHGAFTLDSYIDHLIAFIEKLGPGAHVLGVCQPCNALLATVSVMAQASNPAQPRSMILMAGPVDTRIDPTEVNKLAQKHSLAWFEKNLICSVPHQFKGANRRVYPGFLQLLAFMSMNLPRHVQAHVELFSNIARGHTKEADATRRFYNEYFAVLDLPAEFYIDTVDKVFQQHHLARGIFEWRGHRIDTRSIRNTALLTVEGERDDICAPGQTVAAHDLCPNIKPGKAHHHLQPDVGHYGVFSGGKWKRQVYPMVRNVIAENN